MSEVRTGGTHSDTGGPARLPAQVAGQWGHINWNSVWWGKNILYWADQSSQGRIKVPCTGTTSLINQPRNDTITLSFVLWVPICHFSRGHPVNMQRVFSFGKWKKMRKLAYSSTNYLFLWDWLTDMEVMESALVIYVHLPAYRIPTSGPILTNTKCHFFSCEGGFIFKKRRPLRWNSWKYNFVEVSGHNLEISQTSFCLSTKGYSWTTFNFLRWLKVLYEFLKR